MTTTIQTNIAQRINDLFDQAQAAASTAQAFANSAIESAYECGVLLIQQKEIVGHGNWIKWLEVNCPKITERTAQKYMKLANTNRDSLLNESNLTGAYRKAGILPELEQSTSTSAIVPFVTQLGQKVRLLHELIEPKLKGAKPDDVEQFKAVLKPLHELWERL